MALGVLCPSIFEYRALDKTKLRKLGAVVEHHGMGKVRTVIGCANLAEKKVSGILLVGFAGGLSVDLRIGDTVEPDTFIEQDYCAEPFEKFPNVIRSRSRALLKGSKRGKMLTQDRFLMENPYAGQRGTLSCEMEAYAAAHFCGVRRIPFAVVKLVSDIADKNADHDFLASCRRLAPKLNRTVFAAVQQMRKRVG